MSLAFVVLVVSKTGNQLDTTQIMQFGDQIMIGARETIVFLETTIVSDFSETTKIGRFLVLHDQDPIGIIEPEKQFNRELNF